MYQKLILKIIYLNQFYSLSFTYGAILKGCPHIREGGGGVRGVRQKWTNADRGRGWSNRNTHVCTCSIRMISFFYPSVWIVHKLQCFKECQPCVRTDRERGEWSTKCGQAGTGGGGVPKIPKFVRTSFMNGPYWEDWYTKFFKQN